MAIKKVSRRKKGENALQARRKRPSISSFLLMNKAGAAWTLVGSSWAEHAYFSKSKWQGFWTSGKTGAPFRTCCLTPCEGLVSVLELYKLFQCNKVGFHHFRGKFVLKNYDDHRIRKLYRTRTGAFLPATEQSISSDSQPWRSFTPGQLAAIEAAREEVRKQGREALRPDPSATYGIVCRACSKPNAPTARFCTGCSFPCEEWDLQRLPDNIFLELVKGHYRVPSRR